MPDRLTIKNQRQSHIGALLDVDCEESIVRNLLLSVKGGIPVDNLVAETEKRNRIKLILPWLEAKLKEGTNDVHIYNAMAKIYIDTNTNAEFFLKENKVFFSLLNLAL